MPSPGCGPAEMVLRYTSRVIPARALSLSRDHRPRRSSSSPPAGSRSGITEVARSKPLSVRRDTDHSKRPALSDWWSNRIASRSIRAESPSAGVKSWPE